MNIKFNEVFSVGSRPLSERQGLSNFIKASVLSLGLVAGAAGATPQATPIHETPGVSEQANTPSSAEYSKNMVVVAKIYHFNNLAKNYDELDRGTWNVSDNQDVRKAFNGQGQNSEFQLVLLDPKTRETTMVDVPGDVYSNHCVDGDFRVNKKAKTLIAACDEHEQSMIATVAAGHDASGEYIVALTEHTPFELKESGEFVTSSDIKDRLLEKRHKQENPLKENAHQAPKL